MGFQDLDPTNFIRWETSRDTINLELQATSKQHAIKVGQLDSSFPKPGDFYSKMSSKAAYVFLRKGTFLLANASVLVKIQRVSLVDSAFLCDRKRGKKTKLCSKYGVCPLFPCYSPWIVRSVSITSFRNPLQEIRVRSSVWSSFYLNSFCPEEKNKIIKQSFPVIPSAKCMKVRGP